VTELHELTATAMVRAVRARQVSRRELVQAHLDRIQRLNDAINAIVELRAEQALDEADAADRTAQDRSTLPLDGVPISVKDYFDVAGMKRTEGVRALADRRSAADSVAVGRLRAAGAIIVGKCNMPDFQVRWNTLSELYGPTRNPRDLRLSAGGSSGGDAAAVASGMAALGMGADEGGSIRLPAAFCGIYGLRPTPGRVPDVQTLPPLDNTPVLELARAVGPLARSVEDLWAALEVLAGHHPADLMAPPGQGPWRVARPRPGQARVALLIHQAGATIAPEVEAVTRESAGILRDAGYEVVEADIPHIKRAAELWDELLGTEFLEFSIPMIGPLFGASGRQHAELWARSRYLGDRLGPYLAAVVERHAVARETALWMEEFPLVLSPVAGMPVPELEFDEYLTMDQMRRLSDQMRNAVWVNTLSLPGVALPNGVQIVARRFHEEEALAAAAALEHALGPVPIATPGASRG
jgi:amidase